MVLLLYWSKLYNISESRHNNNVQLSIDISKELGKKYTVNKCEGNLKLFFNINLFSMVYIVYKMAMTLCSDH
jgi:hypothetical protein